MQKFNLKINKAFTLAEVLITLAIIGVIAALTIPMLINKIQKNIIESKLKEVSAILQGAMKRSCVDNGMPNTWTLDNADNEIFRTYFIPYLKTVKECSVSEMSASPDIGICAIRYYSSDDGFTGTLSRKYLLNNGIGLLFRSGSTGSSSPRKGVIMIDISNGRSKLILGQNLFTFNFLVSDDRYTVTGTADYTYPNSLCSMSRANQIDYCKAGVAGSHGYATGILCTAMIECNGWQIPEDYPFF